jgi:hypothetical protein
VDPAGVSPDDLHSFNRYAYANDNPYRYIDPNGEVVFIPVIIWGIGAAWTAYDTYRTYEQEGAAAATKSFARDAAISVVLGGAGKIAAKAYASRKLLTAANVAEESAGTGGAAIVTSGTAQLPFRSGEVILREFQTSKGILDVAAETQVIGRTLHLKDIAVFPRGTKALNLGTREVAALRNQLSQEARALGFDKLRITGTRITGASPGKSVDITIDLTKLR